MITATSTEAFFFLSPPTSRYFTMTVTKQQVCWLCCSIWIVLVVVVGAVVDERWCNVWIEGRMIQKHKCRYQRRSSEKRDERTNGDEDDLVVIYSEVIQRRPILVLSMTDRRRPGAPNCYHRFVNSFRDFRNIFSIALFLTRILIFPTTNNMYLIIFLLYYRYW
jgi:hypothetical protein